MEEILKVENLTKLYKNNRGVRDISFSVNRGDVVGLLGPNGSGKTTVMKTIMGLIHGNSGKVSIFGVDVEEDVENALKPVGGLIESPAIYLNMTAYENLKMASRFYEGIGEERIKKVMELVRI